MSFAPKEFIEIQTENVEKLTGELTRYGNVKINKNLVYPRGWMFTPSVFTDLKKEIKDLK
jgi:hypothetical protein